MVPAPWAVAAISGDTGNAGWSAAQLFAPAAPEAPAQSILIPASASLAYEVESGVQSDRTTPPRAAQTRAGSAGRAGACRDDIGQGRGFGRAFTLRRIAPQFAMNKPPPDDDQHNRIVAVTLDEESIGRSGPDIEHERAIAIYDLIEQNLFAPEGAGEGPFTLHLAITGNRLMFDIRREDGAPVVAHLLSLTPFRRIVKDYFMICDSYYQAIRTATPDKIEAIDMGRRGIHDEGSRTLQKRLKGKVRVDFETARRLFTLICVLHWKG